MFDDGPGMIGGQFIIDSKLKLDGDHTMRGVRGEKMIDLAPGMIGGNVILDSKLKMDGEGGFTELGGEGIDAIIEVIAEYIREGLDFDGDMDIQLSTEIDGTYPPHGMEKELKEKIEKLVIKAETQEKEKGNAQKKRSKKNRAKEKASNKKNSNKKNSNKKNSNKKDSDKKNSNKKDSDKKKRKDAVKKSDSEKSVEIRIRELTRSGLPVL